MIVTEYYMTRTDGVVLNRTYSDAWMMIEREGVRYSEAVDPADLNRQYTETDEQIIIDSDVDEIDVYKEALNVLGVKTEVTENAE